MQGRISWNVTFLFLALLFTSEGPTTVVYVALFLEPSLFTHRRAIFKGEGLGTT